MSKVIAFTSDLGILDDAVALCKGAMLEVCPDATIFDVTHLVTPFDVTEGAQYLGDLPQYFPAGTTFLCVVYPETGTSVRPIALMNAKSQVFVAPNNGLLTLVVRNSGFRAAYELTEKEYWAPEVTPTFYGRDLMAPVAAHIANGLPLARLGPPITQPQLARLVLPEPSVDARGQIVGHVTTIDKQFGNVWTNISRDFAYAHGVTYDVPVEVAIGATRLTLSFLETFGQVERGAPLLYVSSRNYIGIALNQGRLADTYSIVRGMPVALCLTDPDRG